jgi:hypothetical protein
MIEARRLPAHARAIKNCWGDQVPACVEAYVSLLLAQALNTSDEHESDHIIRKIKDGITIRHLPRRADFQAAFERRAAAPAEVKIDWATERVYLVGVGLAGREELEVFKRPVKNRFGETECYAAETHGEVVDGTVLTYTEISWQELQAAEARVERMPELVKEKLCSFFQIQPAYLSAAVLALQSYTDEDFHRIAYYVLQHS